MEGGCGDGGVTCICGAPPARVTERSPGHATRTGAAGDPGLSATATALGPPQHHTAAIPLLRHFRISFPPEFVTPYTCYHGFRPSIKLDVARWFAHGACTKCGAARRIIGSCCGSGGSGHSASSRSFAQWPACSMGRTCRRQRRPRQEKVEECVESIDAAGRYICNAVFFFQFVASTINKDGSTSRPTKIHLIQNQTRTMVRRSLADIVTAIGIMGRARATGVENRKISDRVGGTTETPMNRCHHVRERVNPANCTVCKHFRALISLLYTLCSIVSVDLW